MGKKGKLINTIRGVGYRFQPDETQTSFYTAFLFLRADYYYRTYCIGPLY